MRSSARDLGVSLYLVGGSVRDLLLGRNTTDLDLVTESDGPTLASSVVDRLGGRLTVHREFGTATLRLQGLRLDFSTARRESYPRPGALPEVVPSDLDDDLRRRDFSINAMALGLVGDAESRIIDPCGGWEDLERGIVSVLHPGGFTDDPTRMFRAVRYEQRLGLGIANETLRLLQEALAQNALSTVSGDRIRHELELIFDEDRCVAVLLRADTAGLLAAVNPGLRAGRLRSLEAGRNQLLAYLAGLAYSLSPQQAEGCISRLNMPRSWAWVVRDTVALRSREDDLCATGLRPSEVVEMLEGRDLCALEAVSRLCALPLAAQRIACYLSEWRHAVPVLRGDDLSQLGVRPGRETGLILKALNRARLDGEVSRREEEVALVERILEAGPLELGIIEPERTESGLMEGVGGAA